ncbi:MAG: hypothetical protein WBA10_07340 [Elainellaceae cyanobacterium]
MEKRNVVDAGRFEALHKLHQAMQPVLKIGANQSTPKHKYFAANYLATILPYLNRILKRLGHHVIVTIIKS